ncbi:SIS domain-containing protein [Metapseudomonas otitidis]|uniref:SIS domain-containing protein n=2 Tax=Pseudomonadaceae TaxID=135621 RepID=UPI0013F648FB|nr:SIS domain-containing protein [Pseudomonas otitidis]
MNSPLMLANRVAEFAELIGRCEITDQARLKMLLEDGVATLCDRLDTLRAQGRNLYLVGNGGSASIAAHAATDFFNVGKLKAVTLHESSLMTCMANDFGYENAYARMLSQMMSPGDVLIAISSSGKSQNIRNAAVAANSVGGYVVTLTGFAQDNPLRELGTLNLWLDSHDYGLVEIGHQFLLHNISDRFGARGRLA